MPSRILVISGLPATGKTTLARRVRASLSWPLLSKDDFKERLFDVVDSSDANTSRQLSRVSYALMFDLARQLADAGIDFILEGNFRWSETALEFESLYERGQFTQLWCTAPHATVTDRLRTRAQTMSRHPGHRDADNLPSLLAQLSQAAAALPLPGEVVVFDSAVGTTNLDALIERLRS